MALEHSLLLPSVSLPLSAAPEHQRLRSLWDMPRRTLLALLVVFVSSSPAFSAASASGRWDEYPPSTFAAALRSTTFTTACDLCLTPGIPYTIEAKYLGQVRPMGDSRRRLVHAWLKSIGRLAGLEELYSSEILVVEGGTERWLPIQAPLTRYLTEENPKGGVIEMRVVLVGASNANTADEDYVFVVNAFLSLGPNNR